LTLSLVFESFDGGRDSIERLTQGLKIAAQESPEKSLIVRKGFNFFEIGAYKQFSNCQGSPKNDVIRDTDISNLLLML